MAIAAGNLQEIWEKMNSVYNITSNPTVDTLKQALFTFWQELPLPEKWNQTRSIYNTNSTAIASSEPLNQVYIAVWDSCMGLFNQALLLYEDRYEIFHRWFHGAPAYLNVDNLQQKWNQMDAQYNLQETAIDVFSKFLSTCENFFGHMTQSFNDIFPPETRGDQFRHLLYFAALCLIAYVLLPLSLRLFMLISSLIRFLFSFITFILKCCFYPVSAIFRGLCFGGNAVRFLYRIIASIVKGCFYPVYAILRGTLCFGGMSAVKMMKAPGRTAMMIARAGFEANPQGYFSGLRGKR